MIGKNYYKLQSDDYKFIEWLKTYWESNNVPNLFNSIEPHTTYHVNPKLIRDFEIIQKLDNLGLKIDNCKFFRCRARFKGLAHIDGVPPRHAAINFPIANCHLGYQTWYQNQPEKKEIIQSNLRIIMPEGNNIKWVEGEKMYLNRPTLVNVGIWHGVNNSLNNQDRYVFSIRFVNNPLYEEVKTILETHNI